MIQPRTPRVSDSGSRTPLTTAWRPGEMGSAPWRFFIMHLQADRLDPGRPSWGAMQARMNAASSRLRSAGGSVGGVELEVVVEVLAQPASTSATMGTTPDLRTGAK